MEAKTGCFSLWWLKLSDRLTVSRPFWSKILKWRINAWLRFTGGRIVGKSIWESSRKRVYINFLLAHTFYLIMKVPLFAVLSHHHTLILKIMLHRGATFTSKSYYEAHKSSKNININYPFAFLLILVHTVSINTPYQTDMSSQTMDCEWVTVCEWVTGMLTLEQINAVKDK